MKTLCILFLALYSLQTFSQSEKNIGEKVGYIKNDSYIITIDTIAYKDFLEKNIISIPEARLSKIEILKSKIEGERNDDFYMLIAYDEKLDLKTAHWLVRDADSLYFFQNRTTDPVDDEIFFGIFYTCYSSDTDCFPRVRYNDKKYLWGSSKVFACNPDSPCKSSSTYLYEE